MLLLKNGRKISLLFLSWFILHSVYITIDGLNDDKGKADVGIVLGNTVYADSSLSLLLKGRVDAALQLYKTSRITKIFVSGGKGEFGIQEGDAMKKYLIARKVKACDIITDNDGYNTYETARHFVRLNDSMHFSSALAVTSYYHITRTKYIIRKLGFQNIHGISSKAFFWKDQLGIYREFFAYYKYVLFY